MSATLRARAWRHSPPPYSGICILCVPPPYSRYGVDKLPALAAGSGLDLERRAPSAEAEATGAVSGGGFAGVSAAYDVDVLLLRHSAGARAAPAQLPG